VLLCFLCFRVIIPYPQPPHETDSFFGFWGVFVIFTLFFQILNIKLSLIVDLTLPSGVLLFCCFVLFFPKSFSLWSCLKFSGNYGFKLCNNHHVPWFISFEEAKRIWKISVSFQELLILLGSIGRAIKVYKQIKEMLLCGIHKWARLIFHLGSKSFKWTQISFTSHSDSLLSLSKKPHFSGNFLYTIIYKLPLKKDIWQTFKILLFLARNSFQNLSKEFW